MRILFLTLVDLKTAHDRSIYMDLLDEMICRGNEVTVVSPSEKKYGKGSYVLEKPGMRIIKASTGNLFNVGMIEKGLSQVKLSRDYAKAIMKYSGDVEVAQFDLILYSTPPITLSKVIKKLKRKTGAKTYLLLKDIFPQNAADIGMMKTSGIKGIIYKHFRKQEKELYAVSDRIGCMSAANVEYVLKHNPEVDKSKVEECPNSVKVEDMSVDDQTRRLLRSKYKLPVDKKLFVYGGNLGRPQDIPFVIECLEAVGDTRDVHFLIVGDGTEYEKLDEYARKNSDKLSLMKKLPKEDYDKLAAACDVGLLFLDHRFTIPNFPSRVLSYMQSRLPVFAVTDENTDVGSIAECEGFGWKVTSGKAEDFAEVIGRICGYDGDKMNTMGNKAYEYLQNHYDVAQSCDIIEKVMHN